MSIPYLNSCLKVDCSRKNDCRPFRKIVIPAVLGDDSEDSEVAPENGAYCDALVEYEANGAAYFYSSDGIPTKLTYTTTDYNALTNKPTINGVTLEGNQSSSSLGININDATLTIKQGDSTLGTFSANASENVEINILDDAAIRLRVEWVGGNSPEGWTLPNDENGVRYSFLPNTEVSRHANIIELEIPNVSFTNEKTEESLTATQVFSLIEAGSKVVLDNVPLGAYYPYSDDYLALATTVDNIELSTKVTDLYSEAPAPIISYTGGAYVHGVGVGIATYLGVRLMSYYGSASFYVQGRGHSYADN